MIGKVYRGIQQRILCSPPRPQFRQIYVNKPTQSHMT